MHISGDLSVVIGSMNFVRACIMVVCRFPNPDSEMYCVSPWTLLSSFIFWSTSNLWEQFVYVNMLLTVWGLYDT